MSVFIFFFFIIWGGGKEWGEWRWSRGKTENRSATTGCQAWGKCILCKDLSLWHLREKIKSMAFTDTPSWAATIGREEMCQTNTRIQSGMLMFFYDGIVSRRFFFFPFRTVISIFFIGICTDTSVLEAV